MRNWQSLYGERGRGRDREGFIVSLSSLVLFFCNLILVINVDNSRLQFSFNSHNILKI